MPAVGMLLLAIGLLVAVVGLIRPSLFGRKGQVPKRRDLFFMGVGAAAIGFVIVGVTAERPVGSDVQKAEADKPAGTKTAATGSQIAAEGATKAKPVPTAASKPAIEVPEGAMAKYCANEAKTVSVLRQSEKKFPPLSASASKDAILDQARKASEWEEEQLKPLREELVAELGLDWNRIIYLATEHRWNLKCRAIEAGKPFLDTAEATSATRSDASSARDLLESYYVFRLNSDEHPLFGKGRYNAIRCTWDTVASTRFVGCQPISLSERGSMGVYAVGKNPDGSVLIAPINGTAMTHIEGMPQLKQGEQQVTVASYTGSQVDIPAVLKELQ
ncbi:MAG: hypothetical protein RLO01_06360 [Thalassobaculaceae bacterium]